LASIDINNFLEFNDKWGYEGGDKAIVALARRLSEIADAQGYIVGRPGGDEFAIILPRMSLEKAFLRMEELRKELSGQEFLEFIGLNELREFSVGIGITNYPRDAKDLHSLLDMANEALFSSKEGDRDVVALPSNQEMVLKSCHYSSTQLRRLKALAEKLSEKESVLLREALEDLLKKYDVK
jgi:diguanylate cyclase (GGDEF)-like protein